MNKQILGEERIRRRTHGCAAGRGQSVELYGEVVRDALVGKKKIFGPRRHIFIRDALGFPVLVSCSRGKHGYRWMQPISAIFAQFYARDNARKLCTEV